MDEIAKKKQDQSVFLKFRTFIKEYKYLSLAKKETRTGWLKYKEGRGGGEAKERERESERERLEREREVRKS